jgi:hypothetical protein
MRGKWNNRKNVGNNFQKTVYISFIILSFSFLLIILGTLSSRGAGPALSWADSTPILPMAGNTYYISSTGNNSNLGTLGQPWATPGFGSRQLQPGDTLIILGGRYVLSIYDDDMIIPSSGTADAWITIRGEVGNRPVLAGCNDLLAAVDLSNKSYIKLENIEFTRDNGAYFRDCIMATGAPSNHILLQDLYIHHLDEFGVNFGDVNDLQIINCTITHCGFGSVGGPSGMQGGWRNVTLKGCNLLYSGWYYRGKYYGGSSCSDISPYDRPDGFGIETADGPIEIADTISAFNLGDGLDSKSNNTYIHECVVANNRCDGVKLWGTGTKVENTLIYGRGGGNMETTPWSAIVIHTTRPNSTFELMNVAVDDYIGENYLMHVQYDTPTIPLNLTIKNTIFCARGQNTGIFIAGSVRLILDHNLFYMPNCNDNVIEIGGTIYSSTQLGLVGTGNIYGDPRYFQPALGSAGDYHVCNSSTAIDNGTTPAPSIDLDGTPRPQGIGIDIGAYEYLAPGSDTIKPLVQITLPSNGTLLTYATVLVIGIATDNVAVQKVEISTDGTNWVLCTGTRSWFGSLSLTEGPHIIYIKATDASGNCNIINLTVLINLQENSSIPGFLFDLVLVNIVFILALFHIFLKQIRPVPIECNSLRIKKNR